MSTNCAAEGNKLTTPIINAFPANTVWETLETWQLLSQRKLGWALAPILSSSLENDCPEGAASPTSTDHRSAGVGCREAGNGPAEKHGEKLAGRRGT